MTYIRKTITLQSISESKKEKQIKAKFICACATARQILNAALEEICVKLTNSILYQFCFDNRNKCNKRRIL